MQKSVSVLIKPASSGCNIACRYCFYHSIAGTRKIANYGVMSEQQAEILVKEIIAYAQEYACFAFQGGEPTLAGLDFFEKIIQLQQKYNQKNIIIQNTIQTNGTLIDDKWAEFLAKNKFLVGLSLDGPRGINDFCRVTGQGDSIFDKVMNTIELFEKYEVDFNVVSVVTNKSADRVSAIYNFFKRKGFHYLQFIPCLDEKYGEHGAYSLMPEAYGTFLCRLFDLWYEDFSKGLKIDIRMFSNLYKSEKSLTFMKISQEVKKECRNCQYFYLCRGGCRRWRDRKLDGRLEVNYLCEGYKIFFAHCESRIKRLGEYIRRRG